MVAYFLGGLHLMSPRIKLHTIPPVFSLHSTEPCGPLLLETIPIAGYIPNCSLAVEAMLATSSLGAIWSSTSPDFGVSVSLIFF